MIKVKYIKDFLIHFEEIQDHSPINHVAVAMKKRMAKCIKDFFQYKVGDEVMFNEIGNWIWYKTPGDTTHYGYSATNFEFFSHFEELQRPMEAVRPSNQVCLHSWKQYIGFTEKYEYCEKCDLKKT